MVQHSEAPASPRKGVNADAAGKQCNSHPSVGQESTDLIATLKTALDLVNAPLMAIDAELAWAARANFLLRDGAEPCTPAIVSKATLEGMSSRLNGAWELLGKTVAELERAERVAEYVRAIAEHDAQRRAEVDAGIPADEREPTRLQREPSLELELDEARPAACTCTPYFKCDAHSIVPRQSAPAFANQAGAR